MRTVRSQILCVDADPASVNWIRDKLSSTDLAIDLTSVEGGRSALRTLYREPFDLCISDYALPDMTGVQLCYLIRQIGYSLPIMIFTADNCRIDRDKAAAAGASEFLSKADVSNFFSTAVKRQLIVRGEISSGKRTITTFLPVL